MAGIKSDIILVSGNDRKIKERHNLMEGLGVGKRNGLGVDRQLCRKWVLEMQRNQTRVDVGFVGLKAYLFEGQKVTPKKNNIKKKHRISYNYEYFK